MEIELLSIVCNLFNFNSKRTDSETERAALMHGGSYSGGFESYHQLYRFQYSVLLLLSPRSAPTRVFFDYNYKCQGNIIPTNLALDSEFDSTVMIRGKNSMSDTLNNENKINF